MASEVDGELKRPEKLYKIKSKLSSADDVALLPHDNVAVADRSAGAIKIFDSSGKYMKTLVNNIKPFGVTANRSGLIAYTHVVGKKIHNVQLRTVDGQTVGKWGDDLVWKPWGIATTSRGQLVISDIGEYKHSVGIYTNDGRCVVKFGDKGSGNSQFLNPCYVSVDVMDRILVSDRDNHCVKVFDSQGKYLFKFGSRGSKAGMLRSPHGVNADAQGNILICDSGNQRISVFSPTGKFIQHLLTSEDGLGHPFGMEYSKDGILIVSNHSTTNGSGFKKIRAYKVA